MLEKDRACQICMNKAQSEAKSQVHGGKGCTDLVDLLLSAATAHSDAVDYISLLGFVAQSAGLVWSCWSCQAHNARQLSILPASHSQQDTQDITLLPLPELLHILRSYR